VCCLLVFLSLFSPPPTSLSGSLRGFLLAGSLSLSLSLSGSCAACLSGMRAEIPCLYEHARAGVCASAYDAADIQREGGQRGAGVSAARQPPVALPQARPKRGYMITGFYTARLRGGKSSKTSKTRNNFHVRGLDRRPKRVHALPQARPKRAARQDLNLEQQADAQSRNTEQKRSMSPTTPARGIVCAPPHRP